MQKCQGTLAAANHKLRHGTVRAPAGQGMVEFALAIPVLLLMVWGIIEFGRLLFFYSSVASASREASRYGAAVDNFSDCAGIRDAARRVGFFAGVGDSDITITYDHLAGGATHTGCETLDTDQIIPGSRVRVYVTVDYSPLVPVSIPDLAVASENAHTIVTNLYLRGTPALPNPGTHTATIPPVGTPTETIIPLTQTSTVVSSTSTITATVLTGTPTHTATPTTTTTPTPTPTETLTPTATPDPTATSGAPTYIFVNNLVGSNQPGSGGDSMRRGVVEVTVFDSHSLPASSVVVTGDFTDKSNAAIGSANCTTGSNGICTLYSTSLANSRFPLRLTISGLQGSIPYDLSQNRQSYVYIQPIQSMDALSMSITSATVGNKKKVAVTISVADNNRNMISGASVSGQFTDKNNKAIGSGSCTTDSSGACKLELDGLNDGAFPITFTLTNLSGPYIYDPSLFTPDVVTINS